MSMSDLPRLSEMQADTEQNLVDLLRADLALCTTFADLVLTELMLEDWQAAQSALARSEEGYATVTRLLTKVKDGRHRLSIEQQLNNLRTKLDSLHPHFGR